MIINCRSMIRYEVTAESLDGQFSTTNTTENTFIVLELPSGGNYSITVRGENDEYLFSGPSDVFLVKTPS